jgi:hypothetical protein
MLRGVLASAVALLLVTPAFAQNGGASHSGQAGMPAAAETAPANMQPPTPGDRWTYDVKDEISGALKWTQTDMITDVSKDEITVRFDYAGVSRPPSNAIYDRLWDFVRLGPFKYTPHDGTGIRLPLTLGAQWSFAIDVVNTQNGMTFKRVGKSKVVGHESVTTEAGTFDTFVIETDFTGRNVQDPTLVNQISLRTWFDPDIDHWVKRSILSRQRGHIISRDMVELTHYSRGKQE